MAKSYSKDKHGLLILKKEDIEDEIEEKLKNYNSNLLDKPQPIDIDNFTEKVLGVTIEYHKLSKDGKYYGAFAFNDGIITVYDDYIKNNIKIKEKTIIIDPRVLDMKEGIFNFTLAHEDGHCIWHYPIENNKFIEYDSIENNDFARMYYLSEFSSNRKKLITKEDWAEWQANYTSACILMNRTSVLKFVSNFVGKQVYYNSGFFDEIDPLTQMDLAQMISVTYQVSYKAAMYRLQELSRNN